MNFWPNAKKQKVDSWLKVWIYITNICSLGKLVSFSGLSPGKQNKQNKLFHWGRYIKFIVFTLPLANNCCSCHGFITFWWLPWCSLLHEFLGNSWNFKIFFQGPGKTLEKQIISLYYWKTPGILKFSSRALENPWKNR